MFKALLPLAILLGLAADALCFVLAGAGHGTYLPFAAFFGPLAVLPLGLTFVLGPFLYSGYWFVILRAPSRSNAAMRATAIAILHYLSMLVALLLNGEGLNYAVAVLGRAIGTCLLAVIVFVVINIATALTTTVAGEKEA